MRRQIEFTCQLFREGDQIVSLCPELNVSSFGDTPEEAEAALCEAVASFLEECERMGTLEEAGYSLERRETPAPVEEWRPPRPLKTLHLELALA
jgi:predicted RNase H-like HicB family nuclease